MNTRRTIASSLAHLPLVLVLSIVPIASTGCASKGYLKAKDTSVSLSAAANQVEAARQQLAASAAALTALVNQPTPDLRAAFERYKSSVDALDRTVTAMNTEAENMQKQGQQYFATWDSQLAEMQNENVRARSAARQQEVSQQFTAIQQQYAAARQQFPPLLTRLRDIQRLVSVDLTPTGVRTAQDFASRAEGDATMLRQTLDQLAASFRSLSGVLSPGPTST
jgi:chromosome segregation ATPase